MGTFAKFIESDAFFPILILLLVLLMVIFISVLMSGKKRNKKRELERKNIVIDENAQVQLVEHTTEVISKTDIPTVDIPTVDNKQVDNLDNVDISEVVDNTPRQEVVYEPVDLSPNEVSIPEYHKEDENLNNQYEIRSSEYQEEKVNQNEIVNVDITRPMDESSDIGETFNIPDPVEEDTINEIPAVEVEEVSIDNSNAFAYKPDENDAINEEIIEPSHEYTNEKTEILDFPDFDSLTNDIKTNDIEDKIIDAANKYIESIMTR